MTHRLIRPLLAFLTLGLVQSCEPVFADSRDCQNVVAARHVGVHYLKAFQFLKSLEQSETSPILQLANAANENGGVFEIKVVPDWFRNFVVSLAGLPKYLGGSQFAQWSRKIPRPFVLISDPAITKEILKQPEHYNRVYKSISGVLGDESFFVMNDSSPKEHEQWLLAHKVMVGAFSPNFIEARYVPIMQEELGRLAQRWTGKLGQKGVVENAQEDLDILAIRIGYRAFMNSDLSDYEALHLGPIFDQVLTSAADLTHLRKELVKLFEPQVKICRNSAHCGDHVLGRLVSAQKEQGLSEDWIYDQLITLLFASQETTRYSLGMSLVELAGRPEWQERLRSGDIPLATGFTKEILRLHSPVPVFPRILLKDLTIGAYQFSAGSVIELMPYAQHRNPAVWGEDVLEFAPERWLRDPGPDKAALCAFGGGMRMCIGHTMATTEIRMFISDVVKRWEILPLSEKPQSQDHGGILKVATPLNLQLKVHP